MSRFTLTFFNIIAIFLIVFFLVLPQYRNFSKFNSELNPKKTELQNKERYFSNIEKISAELEKYKEELTKIDSALPSSPSLPSLFNFLAKTATKNGLILTDVGQLTIASPNEEMGEGQIKEINLTATFVGTYPAFKNFLSTIEKSARFIEVENIFFSHLSEKEPFNFNLKIKTHSY